MLPFDAITASRTYHGARTHRRALQVVAEEAGRRLDPQAAAAFLRYYSGRRAVAWSALGFAGTPRLATLIGGPLNAVGASAPPLVQGLAAVVAAALAGAALSGEPQAATAMGEREPGSAAGAQASEPRSPARDVATRDARRAEGGPGGRVVPVSGRTGDGLREDVPRDGPASGPAPPGSVNPGPSAPPPAEKPTEEVPPVEPPDTELPAVTLPDVELPNVGLPNVALPDVTVPLSEIVPGAGDLELELPQIRLPSSEPDPG